MTHDYDLDIETNLETPVKLIMTVHGYNHGTPAPACSNPDSPRFSDPGCPPEFDDVSFVIIVNDRAIELPDEIVDKIYDALENVIDAKLDDAILKVAEY